MPARSALLRLLEEDAVLVALGFGQVYTTNAVDTPREKRFVIIRWEQTGDRVWKSKAPDRATVWFHDRDRDYGQIDKAIEHLKAVLEQVTHVAGGDGWVMTVGEWNGNGPDLFDEGFNTVTRWTDITVISRYDGLN